jgi:hypothetical protein
MRTGCDTKQGRTFNPGLFPFVPPTPLLTPEILAGRGRGWQDGSLQDEARPLIPAPRLLQFGWG